MINRATPAVVVLGAGLAGCFTALTLANEGTPVTLVDRAPRPMMGASRHNEGKLHLGYVYAADERLETHRILARGSLEFIAKLAELTGFPANRFVCSDAFRYIMPSDSLRSAGQIATYFDTVDDTVASLCAELGLPALPRTTTVTPEFCAAHYGAGVRAAFHTPEIAVDPGQVSDIVAAAIYAHPLITFLGGHTVQDVAPGPASGYSIGLECGSTRHAMTAQAVVNALWEDRVRLDTMVGMEAEGNWSQRWKATLVIEVPPGAVNLPSTTALVGPYGDLVLYGRSRIYVSWYPVCRLSMSTTQSPEATRALVDSVDLEAVRTQSLDGLAHLIPGVRDLDVHKATTTIGGGFIMAMGARDIDDKRSGLHERHQIGVGRRDTWVSLSTGKFCTAPLFGEEAARQIKQVLA